jgi:hypothetical protein
MDQPYPLLALVVLVGVGDAAQAGSAVRRAPAAEQLTASSQVCPAQPHRPALVARGLQFWQIDEHD